MKLVFGLGNPGSAYAGTRHNVGFMTMDRLAAAAGYHPAGTKFQAEVAEGMEGEEKVLLVKPQTFMNLSGRTVRQAVDFFKLELTDLLVVTDDVNLPLGTLRLRGSGSAGGHNGLKDIERMLASQDYPRLRLGVSGPSEHQDLADYVLARFRPSELDMVEEMIADAAEVVRCWIKQGLAPAMNRANARKKS